MRMQETALRLSSTGQRTFTDLGSWMEGTTSSSQPVSHLGQIPALPVSKVGPEHCSFPTAHCASHHLIPKSLFQKYKDSTLPSHGHSNTI